MAGERAGTKKLAPTEWLVMQALWRATRSEPEITASELLPAIQKRRKWHFSTLKTTLDRLVRKGYLLSRIRGNTCFYRSAVSREAATGRAIGTFVDNVLDGAFGPLVSYLADRRSLTPEQIEELETLIGESAGKRRDA